MLCSASPRMLLFLFSTQSSAASRYHRTQHILGLHAGIALPLETSRPALRCSFSRRLAQSFCDVQVCREGGIGRGEESAASWCKGDDLRRRVEHGAAPCQLQRAQGMRPPPGAQVSFPIRTLRNELYVVDDHTLPHTWLKMSTHQATITQERTLFPLWSCALLSAPPTADSGARALQRGGREPGERE